MLRDVVIPEISENVETGKVVAVLVAVGDRVRTDDVLVELETEKTVVEIPSPVDGEVAELLVSEGDEKSVGDVIARIDTEAETAADAQPTEAETGGEAAPDTEEDRADEAPAAAASGKEDGGGDAAAREKRPAGGDDTAFPEEPADDGGPEKASAAPVRRDGQEETPADDATAAPVPASPSVRRLARELGADIRRVSGSGPAGRITVDDIKTHVRRRATGASAGGDGEEHLPDFSRWGEIEFVDLQTVRRLTARSTHASWRRIPHVTQFDRADITAVEAFVARHAKRVRSAGGKLTLTAVLMTICAAALKRFPYFNASIDMAGNRLILKHYVHIGMAVDTPRGLLVPVVRDADQKTITQLAGEIADLADRGRNKKLKPDEMEGATFTISNQGGIGGTAFTPIVAWPQVAILGISRSGIEPVYVDGTFEPRTMLPLSLSYDHRVIDGADAARFLRWICESLEQPLTMRLD